LTNYHLDPLPSNAILHVIEMQVVIFDI